MLRRNLGRIWRKLRGTATHRLHAALAAQYLRGHGIEIGALDKPLRLPRGARASYVDRFSTPDLRSHYSELRNKKLVHVDVVDNGETLETVADGSQDFVVACHFLEHCQDPIGTLGQFSRVLRPDGVLFLALPDKRYTFDAPRAITTLDHLWTDHRRGPSGSRRGHFEDFVTAVECLSEPNAIRERADHYMRHDYSIHFHVWTQAEMIELVMSVRAIHGWEIELIRKNGEEVILILRKSADSAVAQMAA